MKTNEEKKLSPLQKTVIAVSGVVITLLGTVGIISQPQQQVLEDCASGAIREFIDADNPTETPTRIFATHTINRR